MPCFCLRVYVVVLSSDDSPGQNVVDPSVSVHR